MAQQSSDRKQSRNRDLQKQRNKRRYAERYRQYEKAATQARQRTESIRRRLGQFVRKHSKAGMVVVAVALFLASILGGLSSCAMIVGSGISGMFAATYTATDPAMLDAEAAYCAMEADCRQRLIP